MDSAVRRQGRRSRQLRGEALAERGDGGARLGGAELRAVGQKLSTESLVGVTGARNG